MMTESRFDPVFDCQEVFKALMNAFAQPGKVFSIEKNVEKLEGQCASLTAAAMVLLVTGVAWAVRQHAQPASKAPAAPVSRPLENLHP